MKERELREHAKCDVCQKKLGETGLPIFWVVTAERHGLDVNAIQRQQGLTMMMNGNAAIAAAMGPDEEMTVQLMPPTKVTVCEICSQSHPALMVALSKSEAP